MILASIRKSEEMQIGWLAKRDSQQRRNLKPPQEPATGPVPLVKRKYGFADRIGTTAVL